MKFYKVALLFAAVLIYGCNQSAKKENASEENNILKEGSVKLQAFGRCDTTGNGRGAALKIQLWQPADSGQVASEIRETLNQKLIDRVNQHGDSASIAKHTGAQKSLSVAFDIFQNNYNDFIKDFPDAPGCWQVDLKGDTVMVTSKMLFYPLDHSSFTGGAHPNYFRSYHAFDAATGKEIEMQDFVKDTTALLAQAEKYFRQTEKIAAGADLEKEGYFLKNHKLFFLPANFVPTPNGVLFYYNPYEIAPYARGVIQFTIPYSELGNAFDRNKVF